MPGAINQIQVLYNAEEDRILLRVNSTENQEFRFWLTRRFSILMLRVLADHAESDPDISLQADPQARKTIKEFKREQAISNADFNKPFRENTAEFPLGKDAQLAFRLTCNKVGENLRLGIHPKKGEGINMVIDRSINTSLTQLLQKAVLQAEWNLASSGVEAEQTIVGKPIIN
jgi:hypothetical protein